MRRLRGARVDFCGSQGRRQVLHQLVLFRLPREAEISHLVLEVHQYLEKTLDEKKIDSLVFT
jgi:hypothetical protein